MKVNVRSNAQAKNYRHNLSHRVNTTSGYGFCQPIMGRELSSGCTVKYRVGQAVYLNPMSKPTFGQCALKTYHQFVPIADIWHPFESFLSGQTYRGSDAHYVPNVVPNASLVFLNQCCKVFSKIYCWTVTNANVSNQGLRYDSLSEMGVSSLISLYTKWNTDTSSSFWTSTELTTFSISASSTQDHPSLDSMDWFEVVTSGNNTYLYGGQFSGFGRDLRKILIGLGYQLNGASDQPSILPLFAYYKVWFDLFAPQRNITWKDTNAYGFMERLEQHNLNDFSYWVADSTCKTLWLDFLHELANCYYTQNPDYVSAHISGAQLPIASSNSALSYVDQAGNIANVTSGTSHQAQITINTLGASTALGQTALNFLRRLHQRINAHTAMGGKIREYMRSVFGSDYRDEKESFFVGSQITDIDISEVMNQAETSAGVLGEYAARGIGKDRGQVYSYSTHCPGYFISIMAVVPDARYCQAVDPNLFHTKRYDFFDETWDSQTLLPTRKMCIYGNQDLLTPDSGSLTLYSGGFGNIPNYMEYKCAYDVLNGEMSQRSKRSTYLPFTLNKILPFSQYDQAGNYTNLAPSLITNGTIWRYIGKDAWLGNFNRIFTNDDVTLVHGSRSNKELIYRYWAADDNFIIHCYLDFNVYAPWLPTADSFDTGSLEGASLKVEKA